MFKLESCLAIHSSHSKARWLIEIGHCNPNNWWKTYLFVITSLIKDMTTPQEQTLLVPFVLTGERLPSCSPDSLQHLNMKKKIEYELNPSPSLNPRGNKYEINGLKMYTFWRNIWGNEYEASVRNPSCCWPTGATQEKGLCQGKNKKVIFDLYNTLNMQIEVFILPAFGCPVLP